MNTTEPPIAAESSLARDLFHAARYYLGGRRGLIVLAALALVAGLALNWGWLAAAGIAPLLVARFALRRDVRPGPVHEQSRRQILLDRRRKSRKEPGR